MVLITHTLLKEKVRQTREEEQLVQAAHVNLVTMCQPVKTSSLGSYQPTRTMPSNPISKPRRNHLYLVSRHPSYRVDLGGSAQLRPRTWWSPTFITLHAIITSPAKTHDGSWSWSNLYGILLLAFHEPHVEAEPPEAQARLPRELRTMYRLLSCPRSLGFIRNIPKALYSKWDTG